MLFGIGLELKDIKANSAFQNRDITPSSACKSEHAGEFMKLVEGLGLNIGIKLSKLAGAGQSDTTWENFTYHWKRSAGEEAAIKEDSYEPLLQYLKDHCKLNAVIVDNGQGLPNGHLFDQHVHTLKKDVIVRSKELRKTGDEPKYIYHLSGRTDVAIIDPAERVVSRMSVLVAIEVKISGFNEDEGLREAFLQLIGLNTANAHRSPVVILTNLANIHYVIFLEAIGFPNIKYTLRIEGFSQFSLALSRALELSQRECFTKHFGGPPTPQASQTSIEEEEEGGTLGNVQFKAAGNGGGGASSSSSSSRLDS